ncbi:hypothetical protein EJF18_30306 [Clavispora lusitaniae]|uniref:Uncharacterized protein n=1 Tax=Clavispora lusitaniae TaxID=36911 RepID=A0ACD0WJU6_CLALS|nr:hypothetical protein EJF14_30306 [Clavispora lusitaniae]QFZ33355.1 hypothetical protein EJF16_30306 [Clavispora lusitaniae]QFZ39026.1 hypothetical protein EJF15_30306 [Clavispora lusitaniae]QFZ44708.1 hypothetical protein EJF18_30306 [Clavispora lusitaniae]QFZ50385.1 hypothetical protein EJF17_30306 [Clavispora lusitaniae]
MSARESSDTLSELHKVNESSKSSDESEDLRMKVDVVFKIWDNPDKFPIRPVRFFFDKNVTVVEASRLAFEAYVDNFRGKIYASIAEGNIAIAVGDDNEKLSTFIQNGEQLIVSDSINYNQMKDTRETKQITLTVVGIFVFAGAIAVVIQHYS